MSADLAHILNDALAHHQAGRLDQAEALYRRLVAQQPEHFDALHLLGVLAAQRGRLAEAEPFLRRATELAPARPEPHNNLANVLRLLGRDEEAADSYRRALALNPDYADALSNLGHVLQRRGQLEEARALCERAVALNPSHAQAWNHLGNVHDAAARAPEAIACYRRAIALAPALPEAHLNLSYALLRSGQYAQGWPEYEWRWRWAAFPSLRTLPLPRWDGSRLGDRRLLVHAEQGLGDTLEFVRYVPLIVARFGGRVILECQPQLERLLSNLSNIERIVTRAQPTPNADVHCPLLSLPLIFGTTLETIPADVPYLRPVDAEAQRWRARLASDPNLKVGLVWAGSPTYKHDAQRSIPFELLAPLARVPGVTFHSLQVADAARQQAAGRVPALVDWTGELKDFADTAALVSALDLVIAVDTSVGHVAGALGIETWLMVPFLLDWRWLLGHEDTPWYPATRLFRQSAPGEWAGVVARVADALAARARDKR